MSLIGLILLVLGIVFSVISKSDYLNICEIIIDHLKIFNGNKKEYVVFYLYPLIFSMGIVFLSCDVDTLYSEISVTVGIILSMLFAGLSILTTYDFSAVINVEQKNKSKISVEQTINAIRFDSLMCLVLLIIIIFIRIKFCFFQCILDNEIIVSVLKTIVPIIVLYFFLVILLVLLLIIKNMFLLIKFNIYAEKK